jgi:hypothetical protein
MPTRFLAGFQTRDAYLGAHPAVDPDCDPDLYPGTSCAFETLAPPGDDEIDQALADGNTAELERIAYDHYLSKSCDTCHAAGYGKNNSRHLYRSTGCSACHMLYNSDGVYEGGDSSLPDNVPVHAAKHQITAAIPTQQCTTCHFQGGRIGLLFQGIREGGFGDPPPNSVPWNESAFGHTAGYYILDEDDTNNVDETPPDVHFAAGMHCSDCHVGSDVHGDGRLYATSKYQVDIRCEDCHGTIDQRRQPDAAGIYHTASGRTLPQLSTDGDGGVVLTGRVDDELHDVPQIADLLGPGGEGTSAMHAAMDRDSDGFSHTESLTCDTCHTSYNQYCIGCHVSMDMRLNQIDHQTGHATTGLVRGSRDELALSHTLLGQRSDGRIQTVIPSQQVQMAVFDREGELVVGEWVDKDGEQKELGVFRKTGMSDANIGFAPFFQHTTTDKPRSCDTCHRTDDSAEEVTRVRGVYGYGTGEFMLPNPDGEPVDSLQFLDADGNSLVEWIHEGTGPVNAEARERAMSVILEDG